MNAMINNGLASAGVTPANMDDIRRQHGTEKLEEYMAEQFVTSSHRAEVADWLGVDQSDPIVDAVLDTYATMTPDQQREFIDRILSLEAKTEHFQQMKVILGDHLLTHRKALVDAQITAAESQHLINGFAATAQIQALRQNYLLGAAPFDIDKDRAHNDAIYEQEMKALFGSSSYYDTMVADPQALSNLDTLLQGTAPDEKPSFAVSDKVWYVNRPGGSGTGLYPEAYMTVSSGTHAIMWVENNQLVYWTKQADGSWAQWRLKRIGATPAAISWFGWEDSDGDGTPDRFALTYDSGSGFAQNDVYTYEFLETLVNLADTGKMTENLSDNNYTAASGLGEQIEIERVPGGDRK